MGASLGIGSAAGGRVGGACWTSTAGFKAGAGGGGGALGFGGAGTTGEACIVGDAVDEGAMSRLVVSATDTVMGGGVTGAAGVIVTWAVWVVGGTNVICGGRSGAGTGVGAGAGASGGGGGFRPCNSSFLSSSAATSVLMNARLCFVSWALPTRSL
jgi:hypothetical protein